MGFTGYVFEIAKAFLTELIKTAIGKKVRKVVAEEVRAQLIQYVTSVHRPSSSITLNADTINLLIEEVYGVAEKSRGIKVVDETIHIKRFRISPPGGVKEWQIKNRISALKKEIMKISSGESAGAQDEIPTNSTTATTNEHEPPLIFPNNQPNIGALGKYRNTAQIVESYKSRIRNILDKEKE